MAFSFNAPAPGSSHSNIKPAFTGNNIYDVTFMGCEVKDIVGKKDTSKTYKTLLIKFSNPDGYYTHTVFEPRDEDFKRPTTDVMGNPLKFPKPSNVETMMLLFKHLIDAVDPKTAASIDSGEKQLGASSWDEIRKIMVELTADVAGKAQTKIKLITGKDGSGSFPFFTGVGKEDGVAYVNNNIIGSKLFFSKYEQDKISGPNGASPSKVAPVDLSLSTNESPSIGGVSAADFDVLGL